MNKSFDYNKPTVEMLGRFQPWHEGHTALFKKAIGLTGQVCIMLRDVGGVQAGVEGQNDNPFQLAELEKMIEKELEKEGFILDRDYTVLRVPNIIDISYGRDVGYTFTQHDLGDDMHKISASKIRAEMRSKGELKDRD